MTQSKRPPEQPEPEPHARLRERVRERMRQMAKLALLAATPLTNAACDATSPTGGFGGSGGNGGLPTPTCEQSSSSWAEFMKVDAAWSMEAGERLLLLTISNPTDKPWLQAPSSYTVEGGTLLPSTAAEPNTLRIKPDANVTLIRLEGTMTCHTITAPMTITIANFPPGGATAGEQPVVIEVG
jgi:hypothetical protein